MTSLIHLHTLVLSQVHIFAKERGGLQCCMKREVGNPSQTKKKPFAQGENELNPLAFFKYETGL